MNVVDDVNWSALNTKIDTLKHDERVHGSWCIHWIRLKEDNWNRSLQKTVYVLFKEKQVEVFNMNDFVETP